MFLSRMSIQKKIFLVLGSGVFGFGTYFSITTYLFSVNRQSIEMVVAQHLPALEIANQIIASSSRLRVLATQAALSQNFESIGAIDEQAKIITNSYVRWLGYKSKHLNRIVEMHNRFAGGYRELDNILQNIVAGIETFSTSQNDFQRHLAALAEIESEAIVMKDIVQNELNNAVYDARRTSADALLIGLIMLICGLFVVIGAFIFIYRIVKSLLERNLILQGTSKKLLDMVEEAQVSASQLQTTANRQASSATETVVSMEQMKRLLLQSSSSAEEAVLMTEENVGESENGKNLVQNLKNSMNQIDRSNSELEGVNSVVKQIRDKTKVINEIVFKTQLLSFNANIEAARAGQHGLGFAVVATEMGNLAEMSGSAAQEINDLLDQSAETVASTIFDTKERIKNAYSLSERCYEFFSLLTERSIQIKSMANSFRAATVEQNTGVEYVVSAMNELNQTASETDRMASGILMLSDNLKQHSLTLSSTVEDLNYIIQGERTVSLNSEIESHGSIDDAYDRNGLKKSA